MEAHFRPTQNSGGGSRRSLTYNLKASEFTVNHPAHFWMEKQKHPLLQGEWPPPPAPALGLHVFQGSAHPGLCSYDVQPRLHYTACCKLAEGRAQMLSL